MLQNFDNLSDVSETKTKLENLRKLLKLYKLDGVIIPKSDMHQDEFIEPCDDRLKWITGFTGSAGVLLLLQDDALIFVDGRYKIQATEQVDKKYINTSCSTDVNLHEFIARNCRNKRIGFDPWLHSVSQVKDLESKCSAKLIPCENQVDKTWLNRPPRSNKKIREHPVKFSGLSRGKKVSMLKEKLRDIGANILILTKPDSISWLLNIRGSDVSHSPIVKSLALVCTDGKVELFLYKNRVTQKIAKTLKNVANIHTIENFPHYLNKIHGSKLLLDPATCPHKILEIINAGENNVVYGKDLCTQMKAIKNPIEINGARQAHMIDGTAFLNFLFWFENKSKKERLNEINVVKVLEKFRVKTGVLQDIAFDTICGSGPNAAIIHYRVNTKTNRVLKKNDSILIDSGGQYLMGTTDVTRTIAVGVPKPAVVKAYTLVLKGLIGISKLVWPPGLSGKEIDAFARSALWACGHDFEHGSGHGIGSYLSVHEGPHGISQKNDVPLMPGMLISIEPGYYQTKAFGVRIENILLVKEPQIPKGGNKPMLSTETLTLVPLDKNLIDLSLLDRSEKLWINDYHEKVFSCLEPQINSELRTWLQKKCSPIAI